MENKMREFCIECRNECEYEIKKVLRKYNIKDREYTAKVSVAFCKKCGAEMNIHGIMDLRMKEIREEYFKEDIKGLSIGKLKNDYNSAKAQIIRFENKLNNSAINETKKDFLKMRIEQSKAYKEFLKKEIEERGKYGV